MLKDAVLRTGCLDAVTSVSGGRSLTAQVLAERLLLVIYAYGTNTGVKAVASGGHGRAEDELRYVQRRYSAPRLRVTIRAPKAIVAPPVPVCPQMPVTCTNLGTRWGTS
ncbi:Tn3 family transposase [Embleya sp. NPDC050154]|uniref:Tn3 family transposase n=1 Tax=Embleya sp. NPDC050154 TaxID=3363988 RepID=UPI00378BCC6E